MAINSLFLTLFFLFITLAIEFKFTDAAGALLDTDGNNLNVASYYSIFPLDWGQKLGGVSYAILGDGLLGIALDKDKTFYGMATSFSNFTKSPKVIEVDDAVHISFDFTKPALSFPWYVIYDESAKVWFLATGSAINTPGLQIKRGNYRISYANSGYKLVFCDDANTKSCKDIGIYIDSAGNSRLAIDRPALIVKFKKTRLF